MASLTPEGGSATLSVTDSCLGRGGDVKTVTRFAGLGGSVVHDFKRAAEDLTRHARGLARAARDDLKGGHTAIRSLDGKGV